MALGPETRLKNNLMPKLKRIPFSHWYKIQQKAIRGTPDILGVVNGAAIALELKSENGRASSLQKFELKKFSEAGGYAMIVNLENQEEVLEDLFKIATGRK